MENKKEKWEAVQELYKNKRLLRLDILHHVNELKVKGDCLIGHDRCPFREETFLKELGDIYLLLELLKLHDETFKKVVDSRRESFIKKATVLKISQTGREVMEIDIPDQKQEQKCVQSQDSRLKKRGV